MDFISIKDLIKILKEKNVNLGKGDPYNRLRYYTKIGWLPHMVRKKDENGEITGHYPTSVIEKIIKIEEYKNQNKNNEEIEKILNINQINEKLNLQKIVKEFINKININFVFIVLILVGFGIEILRYNSLNEKLLNKIEPDTKNIIPDKKIISGGIGILLTNQKRIFVSVSSISSNSIILLNFLDNIGYNNNYFIKEVIPGQGFYLETSYPVYGESKFNWSIIE